MIISATIKANYQKRQTGKGVNVREIKYNVYTFIKAEEFDIIMTSGKESTFQTSCTNIYEDTFE